MDSRTYNVHMFGSQTHKNAAIENGYVLEFRTVSPSGHPCNYGGGVRRQLTVSEDVGVGNVVSS